MDLSTPIRSVDSTSLHTHTIVFLHGRGDNAANFANSLRHSRTSDNRTLFQVLPSCRWVFPQAPTRKWFDVWNVRNFADREQLQAEGLKEVVPVIRRILAAEAELLGGRWERIVLAGISMGAATGAHVLFNLEVPGPGGRLGAFLGFSCRCPFVGRTLEGMRGVLGLDNVPSHDNVVKNTPVLLEHCADDPLVLVQNGLGMRDTLKRFGATVEWREYPAGGHWFNSPAGMDDVVEFVERVVLGKGATAEATTSGGSVDSGEVMDLS